VAVQRDRPYAQFNFHVDLGIGEAGFMECSAIEADVDIIEYRNGNEKDNAVRKLPGLRKYANVTLKRGIIGSLDLWNWLQSGEPRNVTIQLLSEDHANVVQEWKLHNALPVKHVSGPFNAKHSDVAIEELALAYERLELE
jgi:phage tail-like protein